MLQISMIISVHVRVHDWGNNTDGTEWLRMRINNCTQTRNINMKAVYNIHQEQTLKICIYAWLEHE